jgi:hypothetical protein
VLTAVEATDLHDLEQTIEKGLAGFIEVGRALKSICDGKLYREKFGTFEEYLKERWGLSRAHAYRQIEASAVVNALSPTGDTPAPTSERVARELAPHKDDPEKLRQTWDNVVELHGPKPTATQTREVVRRRKKAPAPARKPTKAHMKKRGAEVAKDIRGALLCIVGTSMPVYGWALDALECGPDWNAEEFTKEIATAQDRLAQLIQEIDVRRAEP